MGLPGLSLPVSVSLSSGDMFGRSPCVTSSSPGPAAAWTAPTGRCPRHASPDRATFWLPHVTKGDTVTRAYRGHVFKGATVASGPHPGRLGEQLPLSPPVGRMWVSTCRQSRATGATCPHRAPEPQTRRRPQLSEQGEGIRQFFLAQSCSHQSVSVHGVHRPEPLGAFHPKPCGVRSLHPPSLCPKHGFCAAGKWAQPLGQEGAGPPAALPACESPCPRPHSGGGSRRLGSRALRAGRSLERGN